MISIECDECSKTYKVKPEMAGKRAKCKCGASIQIPAGPKKKKKRLVSTPPKRKKPKAKPKPEADPWDEDPHADDDFGDDFDDYGDDYGDDYEDDYDEPPRRSRSSKKSGGRSKKKGKKRKGGGGASPMKIVGLVFLGVAVLGMLLGLLVPVIGAISAGGIIIVCAALSFAGSLRCMIAAFQEDIMCGVLWFVVPGYSLYYIASRFSELKEYILMWFGGVIGILICVGYFSLQQVIQ